MALRDIFKFRELPESETSKPFLEHLEDLRWTIVKMAMTLVVAMIVCFAFRSWLVRVLQAPLQQVGGEVGTLKALGITDSLVISFHLAFYAGIVIAFPFLIYFAGQFILPALTPQEKNAMLPAVGVGFGLFLGGVVLGYYLVLPATLRFFFRDAQSLDWSPTWTVRDYFSFVTQLCVGFGVAFELPVIVLVLVRLGVLSVALLRRTRAYAFLLIFVAAAFLAPTPDAVSMALMGTPMYLLYELCIFVASMMERKRKRDAEAAEKSG